MDRKYLRPTDDFCMVKSWSQAIKEFKAQGFSGKVFFGYVRIVPAENLPPFFIGMEKPREQNVALWVCIDEINGTVTLPAFAVNIDFSMYDKVTISTVINSGSLLVVDDEVFCYEYESIEVDGQKIHDWTIFSVDCIDNEKFAMSVAKAWGDNPLSAVLHKCYLIKDETAETGLEDCNNFVVPVWKINFDNGTFKLLAAFTEDYILFDLYNFNNLNFHPFQLGKGFVRDKKYFVVADSQDVGYHFYPTFAITKQEPPP